MKIQKMKQLKWQLQLPEDGRHVVRIKNRLGRNQKRSSSFGNIFGLPQYILQQPTLSAIKTIIKAKNNSFKQLLERSEHHQQQAHLNTSLRNTLTNRVKWLLSPRKRQKLTLETSDEKNIETQKQQKSLSKYFSPNKHLKVTDLLQQIILQPSFRPKQKVQITPQASKLPTINIKENTRDKVLAQKHACNAKDLKAVRSHRKTSQGLDKRSKQPYFSAWEVTETSQL